MKRLLIVLSLWLLPTALARAADYLNGDWFILTGKNKISSSNPDHEAVKKIAEFARDDWEVKFLILPADSSYVIHLAGGLWGINPPDSLWKKEDELGKAKRKVKSIALMAQGGWGLLDDRNELAADGIPAPILAPLQAATDDVKKAGGTLRSLAFASDGGWVLLFGKDFKEHGLPKELSRDARRAQTERHWHSVRGVRLGGRLVLAGRRQCLFRQQPCSPGLQKTPGAADQGRDTPVDHLHARPLHAWLYPGAQPGPANQGGHDLRLRQSRWRRRYVGRASGASPGAAPAMRGQGVAGAVERYRARHRPPEADSHAQPSIGEAEGFPGTGDLRPDAVHEPPAPATGGANSPQSGAACRAGEGVYHCHGGPNRAGLSGLPGQSQVATRAE